MAAQKETRKEILRLAKVIHNPENDYAIEGTIIYLRGQLDELENELKVDNGRGSS